MMRWPWQRDQLRPSDSIIVCLQCSGTQPFAVQGSLWNFVRRGGRVIEVQTGGIVTCLQCDATFAIGPNGTFYPKRAPARAPVPEPPPEKLPERPPPPHPRQRPA